MVVRFDAESTVAAADTNLSWTHTPVGTVRGVIVFFTGDGSNDQCDDVTYGGVAMTEVPGSPNVKGTGDTSNDSCYFLGSGIPQGAQTVSITTTGTADRKAGCISLTADADTEIVDSDGTINSDSSANPSVTLSLGGRACFCAIGFTSGQAAVSGIAPLSGWSSVYEHAFAADTCGLYKYGTVATVDVTAGWTQTADDAVAIAAAVGEKGFSSGSPGGGIYVVGT